MPRPRIPPAIETSEPLSPCASRRARPCPARARRAGARRDRPARQARAAVAPPRARAPARASPAAPRRARRPRGSLRRRPAAPGHGAVRGEPSHRAGKPREQPSHGPMLQWAPLPAPSTCRSVPSGTGSRGRLRPWEGDDRDCDDVRDSAAARSRDRRGPAGRADRARAHARRGRGRHVAQPRRLGQAPARLRDQEEERGRVPPRRVRQQRRGARRDRPRPEDRRRGAPPDGDASHRGVAHDRSPRRRGAAAHRRLHRHRRRPPPAAVPAAEYPDANTRSDEE